MSEVITKKFGNIEVEFDSKKNNAIFIIRDCVLWRSGNGAKLFDPEERDGRTNYTNTFVLSDDTKEDVASIYQYLIKEHLHGVQPEANYLALKDGNKMVYRQGDKAGQVYDGMGGNLALKTINSIDKHGPPAVYSKDKDLIEKLDKRVFGDNSLVDIKVRAYAYNGQRNGISTELLVVLMVEERENDFTPSNQRSADDILGGRESVVKDGEALFNK